MDGQNMQYVKCTKDTKANCSVQSVHVVQSEKRVGDLTSSVVF